MCAAFRSQSSASSRVESELNQSQSGIDHWHRIGTLMETPDWDIGLGSTANTVVPAKAGIQGTGQNVLSWTPAYAGATKDFAP